MERVMHGDVLSVVIALVGVGLIVWMWLDIKAMSAEIESSSLRLDRAAMELACNRAEFETEVEARLKALEDRTQTTVTASCFATGQLDNLQEWQSVIDKASNEIALHNVATIRDINSDYRCDNACPSVDAGTVGRDYAAKN